ncbi:MAG: hypothetical protein Q9214_007596, partial [Letrouitia sp. 1 TL-2023]
DEVALFNIFKECETYRQGQLLASREGKIARMCDYWDPSLLPLDAVKEAALEDMGGLLKASVQIVYRSNGSKDSEADKVNENEYIPDTYKEKEAYSIPLGQQIISKAETMNWDWPKKKGCKSSVRTEGELIALGEPWCLMTNVRENLEKYAQMHLGGEPPNLQIVPYISSSG